MSLTITSMSPSSRPPQPPHPLGTAIVVLLSVLVCSALAVLGLLLADLGAPLLLTALGVTLLAAAAVAGLVLLR